MKICQTWKIAVCALLCMLPVDIKGYACTSSYWTSDKHLFCENGCYLKDGRCFVCQPNCVTCSSKYNCGKCKHGYYGPTCDYNCVTCRHGSCTNNNCTYGCAFGYYLHEQDIQCGRCPNKCGTCSSYSSCTSCKAGVTGLECNYSCDTTCASCNRYDKSICNSCLFGYYGTSCEKVCNSNCALTNQTRQCSQQNGDCEYGCVDGWTGSQCTEKCHVNCISCDEHDKAICHTCKAGFYGKSCKNKCSLNCVKTVDIGQCRKSDGQCYDGCVVGWTGTTCREQCPSSCTMCDRWDGTACTSCKLGFYGQSCNIQCSEYCGNMSNAVRQCQQNYGICLDDCVTGYMGDKCDVPCDAGCRSSCDRDTGVCQYCKPTYFGPSCQHLCNATCYDPGNGSYVCDQHSGDCLFEFPQFLGSLDGVIQDAQKSVTVAVICGAVGSIVMIVLVVAAVLVFMFHRKRRINMSDPERRITYDKHVHIEDENTDDNVYSVSRKKRRVKENIGETQSTAHSTLLKLPSNGPVTTGDVVYTSYMGSVPVIPPRLGVDELEDNIEELCMDEDSGSLKANSTLPKLTPPKAPVANGDFITEHAGCVPVIPSGSPVDEPEYSVEVLFEDEAKSGDLKEADWPNVENYYNIGGLTRSRVKVDTFRDQVTSISKKDFQKEFKNFPKGLTRPYGDALKPTNVSKNRYKGIYPYDSTRVKLTWEGGDYINASYIQGFKYSEKTYIASSGPAEIFMKGYVEFWEMVWQEKVDKIVMLTNFIEETKMKCEKYWPDVGEYKSYGDIDVHCMSAERYADFTVTKLTMKKDSKVTSIHHYHFSAWPDRGTPENVVSLVEFRESVEHIPKTTEGPTVVHCSAGIGRTGIYIALDILTREGRNEKYVDVYGCVLGLRGQRVLMIQNVEQYRFLHYALSHSLTNKCNQIAGKNFCTFNADEIQRQFQLLRSVIVLHDAKEENAIEKNRNANYRNRNGASIPGDAHRPRLFKYNQNSKSDYINAIYVDGYREKNRYIVAQTPLSETVEDFLGLALQENCFCIISLDPVILTSKQDIGYYIPDINQEVSVGNFKVICIQREITADYILSKLTVSVQEMRNKEAKTILHYQYTEWPEQSKVPSSTGSFLNLLQVSKHTAREPNMPLETVIIHCLAGGDRSGLFPVVANILEKIDSEQQASIVNVVSQVQARRPRAIPNKEQFKYCYELASLFVENNSV